MDPSATQRAIIEAIVYGYDADLRTHCRALINWLDRGGFAPTGYTRESARAFAVKMIKKTPRAVA